MKNIIILVLGLLLAVSCSDNKKQEVNDLGFIVEKDYDHTRMCCSQQHFERLLIVIIPHTSPPPHHHHKIDAVFSLWFANRNGATEYNVDSLTWIKYKVGDKVISQTDTNNYHRFFIVKD